MTTVALGFGVQDSFKGAYRGYIGFKVRGASPQTGRPVCTSRGGLWREREVELKMSGRSTREQQPSTLNPEDSTL